MFCRISVKLFQNDSPGARGFGRGVVELLEGVERFGSINQATNAMGMAYSKAWRIIKTAENEMGLRLVDRDGAHGSALTEEARALLTRYREAEAAAAAAAEAVLADSDL